MASGESQRPYGMTMYPLAQIYWFIVAQVTAPGAEGGGGAAEKAAEEPGLFSNLMVFLPMMLLIMLVYIVLLGKSPQKDGGKTAELLANLKKHDRVVTAGGIIGTVTNFRQDTDYITIRIDDASGTKMQILKQAIVRVIDDSKEKTS